MTINDVIAKILFRINYDITVIFIGMISLFRNYIEQHEKNNIICDILFENCVIFCE